MSVDLDKAAAVPEAWRFVDGEVPGCYAAWLRDVRESREPRLGVTGSRKRGTYQVLAWWTNEPVYWRLFATEMRWVKGVQTVQGGQS